VYDRQLRWLDVQCSDVRCAGVQAPFAPIGGGSLPSGRPTRGSPKSGKFGSIDAPGFQQFREKLCGKTERSCLKYRKTACFGSLHNNECEY
jgi:hypothetical protein